ncbi:MAG: SMP-30/gluconolactonase/LRE family protein [Deltaproteobacteria bacterium]|nr:SMP-30/gluconolactonase/LRE family protein [Deltaproteobacteria bacterium]
MKKNLLVGLLVFMIFAILPALAMAQSPVSPVPLPPTVAGLPAITAELWLQVDTNPAVFLEGPAFDREGNLFVSSIFDGRILKITPDKKVSTVFAKEGLMPDGIAIHKDGRLFLACISGKFIAISPDGSNPVEIEARYQGKPQAGNDLVFDRHGNLFVTDWTGTIADATGGVYRFSADFKGVEPVFQNLVTPNGVALSPDGNSLWVSETNRNQLVCLNFQPDSIKLDPIEGTKIPWRFTGCPGGPDSNAMDEAGNLYQCVIFQGRVLILNKMGIPLANVLVPGRDQGKFLRSTNVAFKPGTDEVYLTASGEGGAAVYRFKGLARGLTLFSHQ